MENNCILYDTVEIGYRSIDPSLAPPPNITSKSICMIMPKEITKKYLDNFCLFNFSKIKAGIKNIKENKGVWVNCPCFKNSIELLNNQFRGMSISGSKPAMPANRIVCNEK